MISALIAERAAEATDCCTLALALELLEQVGGLPAHGLADAI